MEEDVKQSQSRKSDFLERWKSIRTKKIVLIVDFMYKTAPHVLDARKHFNFILVSLGSYKNSLGMCISYNLCSFDAQDCICLIVVFFPTHWL